MGPKGPAWVKRLEKAQKMLPVGQWNLVSASELARQGR
jgi:hypothetical protein